MKKSTQAGRSMIEMLGVLAIIGVLSVAGIAGYSMAMNKYRTSRVMDEIQMLGTNIRTLYATQGSYNGINTKLLFEVQVMDRAMCPESSGNCKTSGTNAFGGDINVNSANGGSGTDSAFSIEYVNIPRNACVTLATTAWGGSSSGLISLTVNGSTTDSDTLPISIVNANTSCSKDANNSLTWTMR
jgi:type II secretory pathway pseudopilin PulG